jgi:hypothetical protein
VVAVSDYYPQIVKIIFGWANRRLNGGHLQEVPSGRLTTIFPVLLLARNSPNFHKLRQRLAD